MLVRSTKRDVLLMNKKRKIIVWLRHCNTRRTRKPLMTENEDIGETRRRHVPVPTLSNLDAILLPREASRTTRTPSRQKPRRRLLLRGKRMEG
jgi:hypothetical protein